MENHLGEYYVFSSVGSGKDNVTVTLAYRKTKPAILRAYHKYQRYVGRLMNEVPKE